MFKKTLIIISVLIWALVAYQIGSYLVDLNQRLSWEEV